MGMNTPPAQNLFRQASEFHQKGHLVEAEQLYRQLIAALPLSPEPRHMLGVLRLQQGRNSEALELIGAALKINPRNADMMANYGSALKGLGRFDEAIAAYEKALAIRPDFAGALYNRALLQ
jgi:protein O-GlcNAc transferase